MNPTIMARDRYVSIISVYVRAEQSVENISQDTFRAVRRCTLLHKDNYNKSQFVELSKDQVSMK